MLAICTAASYDTQAQTVYNKGFHGDITGLDTLEDAAADTTVFEIKNAKHAITIQTNTTKIGGTVAGTIVVQGTIDTSAVPKWVTLETDNLTDASAVHSTSLTVASWIKYRIIRTTTGTQESSHQTFLMVRDN